MIRSALLLCAGLLAAASLACVAQAPPQQLVVKTWPLAACDRAAFVNAVQTLKTPFDPRSLRGIPEGDPSIAVPDNIKIDLGGAFDMAPQFFRDRLCGLNGVFINPQAGPSWGFRRFDDGAEYIAISAGLWPTSGAPAQRFRAFETGVMRGLLKNWTGPDHPNNSNDPTDGPATTVLASLAHEYGHILWYDTFVKVRGGPGSFDRPEDFCGGTFYRDSWVPITDTPPPNKRWMPWGEVSTTEHLGNEIRTRELLDAIPGNPGQAARLLNQIYRIGGGGRWAGLFAIFSPEEDFVETFKLFVLQKSTPSLVSLPTRIPGFQTRDIPGTCSFRPVLQRKLSCFAPVFCGQPWPADPCTGFCAPLPPR